MLTATTMAEEISNELGLHPSIARESVKALFEIIADTVINKKKNVEVEGIGRFFPTTLKSHTRRDIVSGNIITTKEWLRIGFRPYASMRNKIAQIPPSFKLKRKGQQKNPKTPIPKRDIIKLKITKGENQCPSQ
jgi:nucleoid DNA-binding protein